MDEISRSFSDNHRRCDEMFISIEQAVSSDDWEAAESAAIRFVEAMDHHFSTEEDELFPTLKQVSPGAQGPVQVMLMEHEQMRSLFEQLKKAVVKRDERGCLDLTETLLMIMQQHNMKEENILYPMADRSLGPKGAELAQQLAQD